MLMYISLGKLIYPKTVPKRLAKHNSYCKEGLQLTN